MRVTVDELNAMHVDMLAFDAQEASYIVRLGVSAGCLDDQLAESLLEDVTAAVQDRSRRRTGWIRFLFPSPDMPSPSPK